MAGASAGNAKVNYDTANYRLFYESLIYLQKLENKIFKRLTKDEVLDLNGNIF